MNDTILDLINPVQAIEISKELQINKSLCELLFA